MIAEEIYLYRLKELKKIYLINEPLDTALNGNKYTNFFFNKSF